MPRPSGSPGCSHLSSPGILKAGLGLAVWGSTSPGVRGSWPRVTLCEYTAIQWLQLDAHGAHTALQGNGWALTPTGFVGVQHLPRGPMPWPSGALPVLCWGGRHSHTFTCLIHQKEARQHVLPSFLSQGSGVPKPRVWHKEGSCPQPSPTDPAPIISAQPTWSLPLCFQPIHTMALSRPVALRTICILMAAH